MSTTVEIRVPALDDFESVEVIEILAKPGDTVAIDDSLVTLESDKAAMEVPSTAAGKVKSVAVKVNDSVGENDLLVTLEATGDTATDDAESNHGNGRDAETHTAADTQEHDTETHAAADTQEHDTETHTAADTQERDTETHTAADTQEHDTETHTAADTQEHDTETHTAADTQARDTETHTAADTPPPVQAQKLDTQAYASPAVRRLARELAVDLNRVRGSGDNGRILKEDVKQFARQTLSGKRSADKAEYAVPPVVLPDFSVFGETEEVKIGRIDKLSSARMRRSWLNVPHVTHHDEADVTELEALRKTLLSKAESKRIKLTLLPFLIHALVDTLADFPKFNASLNEEKGTVIYKRYFHVAIAVDTPQGLIAPVLRDADQCSVFDIAHSLEDLSVRARNGQLRRDDVTGASITITNLGGLGGTAFTPIVNTPEVAILGVCRARTMPVWDHEQFIPRLLMPLDLSYDHRVINGADAARFMVHYCRLLTDPKRFEL